MLQLVVCINVITNDSQAVESGIIDPIEKIGGLLYVGEYLGDIVVEELRKGKSFATLEKINPDIQEKIKRYELKVKLISESGIETLKISNKTTNRTLFFRVQKGEKSKLVVYNQLGDKGGKPIFEVEVEQDYKIRSDSGFFVPLEINELMKWYFDESEYMYLMTNHLTELFINLLAIKYETIIPKNNQDDGDETFHDLKLLKKDRKFMGTFYNIQEFVESNFDLFNELQIV